MAERNPKNPEGYIARYVFTSCCEINCDDTKCLIELGGAMGTDLVVAGSISKIANEGSIESIK